MSTKTDALSEVFEGLGESRGGGSSQKAYKKFIVSFALIFIIGAAGGAITSGGIFYYLYESGKIKGKEVVNNVVEKVTVEEGSAVVDAVKKISPSVVSITTTSLAQSLWGNVVEQQGGGTGFVVTNDGLIMTNKHVIAGATDLKVVTNDGQYYEAKVVAQDPLFDIALVKIEAKGLVVAELGDSDALDIGQKVVTIGNALGEYQNSATAGIISARARAITASDKTGGASRLEGLIQTDAPINPGNSGGPLVNIRGQVVGINTAIDQSGNSIGFAIPINGAKVALDSYLKNGKIIRPYIGVRYVNITRDFASINKLDSTYGALITTAGERGVLAVVPGGPADKAGLKENDIILEINGEKVTDSKGVISILSAYAPGQSVEVKYMRKGEEKTVNVVLGELK